MASFNHNPNKSSQGNSGFKGGSNKPSGGFSKGGQGKFQGQGSSEIPPTTHYMAAPKTENGERQFVKGIYITEVDGGLKVRIKESIEPGTYYINKKKDKKEDAPNF